MINLIDVNKSYNNTVLSNISIKFNERGLYGITGRSGSGKSTLLNLVAGLDTPSSGDIYFNDALISEFNINEQSYYRREYIGFIFQDYQLINNKTVFENVKMGLTFAGLKSKTLDKDVINILKQLNISNLVFQYPNKLSGGEKQRVAIARALIKNPKVIIADEPTGSLDLEQARSLMDILKEISKTKLVIIASHDITLLKEYADYNFHLENKTITSNQTSNVNKNNYKSLKPKVSNLILFKYALSNLITQRIRTLILLFILILSLTGVSLSYHFDNALNGYIKRNEQQLVNVFPIEIDSVALTINPLNQNSQYPLYPNYDYVLPSQITNDFLSVNNLDNDFYEYMKLINPDWVDQITLIYNADFKYIKNVNNELSYVNLKISPLNKSETQINYEFDVLHINNLISSNIGVTLVVDNYNQIPISIPNMINIPTNQPIAFEDISNYVFYYAGSSLLYEEVSNNDYRERNLNELSVNDLTSLNIKRIIRQKEGYDYFSLNPGIYINNNDYQNLFTANSTSPVIVSQLNSEFDVVTGLPFTANRTKDSALKTLGYANYPTSYRISTNNYSDKLSVLNYIDSYPLDKITPLDKAELGLSFARNVFYFFTVIGLGFITISVVFSVSTISLSTYTSIIERKKEIGILKSLGASQNDIIKTFIYELLSVGIVSSFISGILILIIIPIIDIVIKKLTAISNAFKYDFIFIGLSLTLSVVFVLLIGLIPVYFYNRRQAIDNIKSN